jgi:hypothetical protein
MTLVSFGVQLEEIIKGMYALFTVENPKWVCTDRY